jgi:hypothetical protein
MSYRNKTYVIFDGDNDLWATEERLNAEGRRIKPTFVIAKEVIVFALRLLPAGAVSCSCKFTTDW